jgi:hypothetical protein
MCRGYQVAGRAIKFSHNRAFFLRAYPYIECVPTTLKSDPTPATFKLVRISPITVGILPRPDKKKPAQWQDVGRVERWSRGSRGAFEDGY